MQKATVGGIEDIIVITLFGDGLDDLFCFFDDWTQEILLALGDILLGPLLKIIDIGLEVLNFFGLVFAQ